MSHRIARRSLLRSLLGGVCAPFLARPRAQAEPGEPPGRFTADGQPLPLEYFVAQLRTTPATAIYRRWRPEDVPLCKLCPAGCSAVENQCMVIVSERVAFADARLYSTAHVTMVKSPLTDPA